MMGCLVRTFHAGEWCHTRGLSSCDGSKTEHCVGETLFGMAVNEPPSLLATCDGAGWVKLWNIEVGSSVNGLVLLGLPKIVL